MANIKFSAFTQLAPIDQGLNGSYIVGYEGDANTNNRWTFGEVAIGLKAVTATPYSIYSASGALEATREVTFSAHDLKFIATGNGKLWYQDGNQAAGYVLKSDADGEASWGVLSVAGGGTGQTSYTDGQLLIGNTTGNTLTKATLTAGTGVTVTNGAGSITIANSAPDQTVALTGGTGISTSGTYPNFTITNDSPNQATPAAGSSGQLQYNNGSNGFAASANLAFDAINDILTVQDNIVIKGDGTNDASKLKFNCYNNNHHVEIIGPDHAGSPASYSIKLPNALPNVANQILESNASGTLSWIATPTDTDTSIYAANGNLTADRTVTMNNAAADTPYNLTFAGITTSKVTFSNLGGAQFDEDVTFVKNSIIQGQAYTELNSLSNTLTINWNDSNVQAISGLTGSHTFTPTNPKAGATYILTLIQTGAVTATWGSYIKWAAPDSAATPPTLSGSGKTDVITLICWSATANSGAGGYYGSITKDLS